jgi:predicted ABC-type ATPase
MGPLEGVKLVDLLEQAIPADTPTLIVFAGGNGSGKSTLYDEVFAVITASQKFAHDTPMPFVNADRIARGLLPSGDVDADNLLAAKLADAERHRLLEAGQSFCMETVFSDRGGKKLEFFVEAQRRGYAVVLLFVGLASPELAILRVQHRVQLGGHAVKPEDIRDRYPRTLTNLAQAIQFVTTVIILDNSEIEQPYRFVAAWHNGEFMTQVSPPPKWYTQVLAILS